MSRYRKKKELPVNCSSRCAARCSNHMKVSEIVDIVLGLNDGLKIVAVEVSNSGQS